MHRLGPLWADAVEKLASSFGLVSTLRAFSVRVDRFEQGRDRVSQPTGADGAVVGQSFASFRRFRAVAASVNSSFTPTGSFRDSGGPSLKFAANGSRRMTRGGSIRWQKKNWFGIFNTCRQGRCLRV